MEVANIIVLHWLSPCKMYILKYMYISGPRCLLGAHGMTAFPFPVEPALDELSIISSPCIYMYDSHRKPVTWLDRLIDSDISIRLIAALPIAINRLIGRIVAAQVPTWFFVQNLSTDWRLLIKKERREDRKNKTGREMRDKYRVRSAGRRGGRGGGGGGGSIFAIKAKTRADNNIRYLILVSTLGKHRGFLASERVLFHPQRWEPATVSMQKWIFDQRFHMHVNGDYQANHKMLLFFFFLLTGSSFGSSCTPTKKRRGTEKRANSQTSKK